MVETTYTIKTPVYEGPFELLLDMVEKRKLFVNDISLASVTDDFLGYLEKMKGQPPSYVSSFIVVAATLLLIKSRSLLPNFNLTDEENEEIGALERRLVLYKIITDVGLSIRKIFGFSPLFMRGESLSAEPIFTPTSQISLKSMNEHILSVLNSVPIETVLPQVEVKKVVSIEEMLSRLVERIGTALKTSFNSFTGIDKPTNREEKVLVIVSFLAMLELVRQGTLDVIQGERFGDMELLKMETVVLDTQE